MALLLKWLMILSKCGVVWAQLFWGFDVVLTLLILICLLMKLRSFATLLERQANRWLFHWNRHCLCALKYWFRLKSCQSWCKMCNAMLELFQTSGLYLIIMLSAENKLWLWFHAILNIAFFSAENKLWPWFRLLNFSFIFYSLFSRLMLSVVLNYWCYLIDFHGY